MSDTDKVKSTGFSNYPLPTRRVNFAESSLTFQEELLSLDIFQSTLPPAAPTPPSDATDVASSSASPANAKESTGSKDREEDPNQDQEASTGIPNSPIYTVLQPTVPAKIQNSGANGEKTTSSEVSGNDLFAKEHGGQRPVGEKANGTANPQLQKPKDSSAPLKQEIKPEASTANTQPATPTTQNAFTPSNGVPQPIVDDSAQSDAPKQPVLSELQSTRIDRSRSGKPSKDQSSQGELGKEDATAKAVGSSKNGPASDSSRDAANSVFENEASETSERNEGAVEPVRNRRAERLEKDKGSNENPSRDPDGNRDGIELSSLEEFHDFDNDPQLNAATLASLPSLQLDANIVSSEPIDALVEGANPVESVSATPGIAGPSANQGTISGTISANTNIATNISAVEQDVPIGAVSSLSGGDRTGRSAGVRPFGGAVRGSLSPYQENKLVQRVLKGFEQLSGGGGQVRIRLHPPELGTLQMTLRIEANQVAAKLEVENSLAKDALLNNTQTLRDRLAEQGFEIQSFEVEIRSETGAGASDLQNNSGGQDGQYRWQGQESRFAALQANRLPEAVPSGAPAERSIGWIRNGDNLDLTV